MLDIFFETKSGVKRVAMYDEINNSIIVTKKLNHLYNILNAFCINKEVLKSQPGWQTIDFIVGNVVYSIDKEKVKELDRVFHLELIYGAETQIALPVIVLNKVNKNTGFIEKAGVSIKDFIEQGIKSKVYTNWAKRIKSNYYFIGEVNGK